MAACGLMFTLSCSFSFAGVDVDRIDFAQFYRLIETYQESLRDAPSQEEIVDMFAVFDSLRNGTIDSAEFARILIELGEPLNQEDAEMLMAEIQQAGITENNGM